MGKCKWINICNPLLKKNIKFIEVMCTNISSVAYIYYQSQVNLRLYQGTDTELGCLNDAVKVSLSLSY